MFRGIAIVVFAVAALIATGCTQTSAPKSVPSASTVQVAPQPQPGLTPRERLRRSLELLEEGDERTARVELVEYVSELPRSRTGRSLLRQIDTPPEDYYPARYREVVLETGQSLSTIAKIYLGSAVQFHALAKYNGIARPRRVVPGQVIKVPLTDVAVDVFAGLDSGGIPVVDIDTSGEAGPESAQLPAEPGESTPLSTDDAAGDDELLPASSVSEAQTITADESEEAAGTAAEFAETGSSGDTEAIGSMTPPATDAENALTEAEEDVAGEIAAETVELVPEIDVNAMHRQAITAYRSQDLDTAIELWNQILAADPDYESARLYRSQARALKERLKSLN